MGTDSKICIPLWCGGGQLLIDLFAFSWDKGEHIELGISTYRMASKQLSWFLLKYEESNTLDVEVVKNKQTKQQKTTHKTKQNKTNERDASKVREPWESSFQNFSKFVVMLLNKKKPCLEYRR